MSRATVIITDAASRQKVMKWANSVPRGTRIDFKSPRRSLPQNAKLWASLTDIAQQVDWHGQKLSAEDWKDLFTASLRQLRLVPGIDGGGFVPLGMRTSDMTKQELGDLLELITAFGAEHGVVFHDQEEAA